MKKKTKQAFAGNRGRVRNILLLLLGVLILFAGALFVYADRMLDKIHYTPDDAASDFSEAELSSSPAPGESALPPSGSAPGGGTSSGAGTAGGLYHDDAVKNILLLGVDDYQPGDPGRSDSMMLVSVDARHKKLKLTSLMRDLYVAIPGHGRNKLNSAYHFAGGGAAGARLTVRTVENSFGVDIDRYVIIGDSAFDRIVERMGGVTVTVTAEEAALINQNSGDPRRNLTAGTFRLSGKQAHYYSRIRAIGDDFARTERQRKVFASAVSRLRSQSFGTINGILSDTLGLVTTNMSKGEVLALAADAPVFLKYPVSQLRIPANGEYYSDSLAAGSVLVPDLAAGRGRLASFLYESDRPSLTGP